MEIDLLYFDGCPNWQIGLENLKAALEAERLQADIHLVKVEDDAQAANLKFLGSPSFRTDDLDFWPEERKHYNLSCRTYVTSQGLKGVPTTEMLRGKLHAQHP